MAKQSWMLTQIDQDIYVDRLTISPGDVPGAPEGFSVVKRRLCGGLRDGVDVVEVDNGTFRFVVVPTRGMGVWEARMGDLRLGWQSPVKGPVHPAFVPVAEASGLGWAAPARIPNLPSTTPATGPTLHRVATTPAPLVALRSGCSPDGVT